MLARIDLQYCENSKAASRAAEPLLHDYRITEVNQRATGDRGSSAVNLNILFITYKDTLIYPNMLWNSYACLIV